MANLSKNERVVGIDIGSASLKLTYVSGNKIEKAFTKFLTEALSLNEKRHLDPAMPDFIRQAVKEAEIPFTDAAIVLPSSQVYVRSVTMPAMTEQQLKYNIPFEFRDYLTEDNNKYFFDYSMEKMFYDENGKPTEMKLFICAVLKQTIEEYKNLLKKVGFKLKYVVPAEYAISVALKNIPELQENTFDIPKASEKNIEASDDSGADPTEQKDDAKYYCVADVGYKMTELFFFYNNHYRLKRTVDFGMYDLERIVAGLYDTDNLTARKYIMSNKDGILESEQCKETYNALAVELMKVVNYFNYNNREAELDSIYICNGGASISYIGDAVQTATNFPVHPAADLIDPEGKFEDSWNYLQSYGCTVQE